SPACPGRATCAVPWPGSQWPGGWPTAAADDADGWTRCDVGVPRPPGPHAYALYGRGMLRRFERAIAITSPAPPPITSLVMAIAKPLTWPAVTFGGTDRAFGSVTTSTRAGP